MKCNHDLAERETECADGACPICLRARIAKLEKVARQLCVASYCEEGKFICPPAFEDAVRAAWAALKEEDRC